MVLTIDTTLLTNVCTFVGKAHNNFIRVVGDEGDCETPTYWVEAVKSYVRGGNDLTSGIVSGSAIAVAAEVSPNNQVNVTGGNVLVLGSTVAVSTNATFGSATIFPQTCTDGSPLLAGQFYDAALCADHVGVLTVFRGPREDRTDTEARPSIPRGYAHIATIRIRFAGPPSVIQNTDITLAQTLTAYSAQTTDPAARIFGDFDAGQAKMISRSAVKNELGFALTSLDKYVQTITAANGLGTGGAGLSLLAWAKSTHQTATPFDFPPGFAEFIRVLRNGKDFSTRIATVAFTGSGTATVTDLKKVLGSQDSFELIVTNVGSTGSAASTIQMTVQTTGATTSQVYLASVPAAQANGTVIPFVSAGTAALQTPIPGTAILAALNASNVNAAQPAGTVIKRIYTSLVPTTPIAVTGGTNGDIFAIRNVGSL